VPRFLSISVVTAASKLLVRHPELGALRQLAGWVEPCAASAWTTGFCFFIPRFSSSSFQYRLRMVPPRTRQNHIAHQKLSYGTVLGRNGH
jgi:hypothetical protein